MLVSRYREMVYAVCRRRLGPLDAEDATQETFLKLVRNPGQVQTSVCAWLHSVATTTAIDWGRRETRALRSGASRNAMLHHTASCEDNTMDEAELRTELDQAVSELEEPLRVLVVEHFLGGRTQSDLAAEHGCSVATISRRLSGAVEMIKRRLSVRGYTTATVAGLVSLLSTQAMAADLPAGLTLRILSAAGGGTGGASAASTGVSAVSTTASTATTTQTMANWGASKSVVGMLLPVAFGVIAVVALAVWLFMASTPPPATLPPVPAAVGAALSQAAAPEPVPPTREKLRVGWVMDAPLDATGEPDVNLPNRIIELSNHDRIELVLVVPRQAASQFDGITKFMMADLPRRYFDDPDPFADLDVVVIAKTINDPQVATAIWNRAEAAWRGGIGLVLYATQRPDTPGANEMIMARSAVAFHHPEGHGQKMPAKVLQSHPILDRLQPGDMLSVCACGSIMEIEPGATVLVMRDGTGLPVAEQAAAANLNASDMPFLMIHDASDGSIGRRVVAPMTDFNITSTNATRSAGELLERSILWAGRELNE